MAPKLTDKERARIVAYLKEDKSHNWIAKEVKRSKDTVGRIARENGIESDGRRTKKATEAAAAIREIDRFEGICTVLRVGASLIAQLEGREPTPEVMRSYKDGATGYAIGIDKHRLEMGEATNRSETVDSERRKRIQDGLDELARHRATRRPAASRGA
jgi:hypothetical protein